MLLLAVLVSAAVNDDDDPIFNEETIAKKVIRRPRRVEEDDTERSEANEERRDVGRRKSAAGANKQEGSEARDQSSSSRGSGGSDTTAATPPPRNPDPEVVPVSVPRTDFLGRLAHLVHMHKGQPDEVPAVDDLSKAFPLNQSERIPRCSHYRLDAAITGYAPGVSPKPLAPKPGGVRVALLLTGACRCLPLAAAAWRQHLLDPLAPAAGAFVVCHGSRPALDAGIAVLGSRLRAAVLHEPNPSEIERIYRRLYAAGALSALAKHPVEHFDGIAAAWKLMRTFERGDGGMYDFVVRGRADKLPSAPPPLHGHPPCTVGVAYASKPDTVSPFAQVGKGEWMGAGDQGDAIAWGTRKSFSAVAALARLTSWLGRSPATFDTQLRSVAPWLPPRWRPLLAYPETLFITLITLQGVHLHHPGAGEHGLNDPPFPWKHDLDGRCCTKDTSLMMAVRAGVSTACGTGVDECCLFASDSDIALAVNKDSLSVGSARGGSSHQTAGAGGMGSGSTAAAVKTEKFRAGDD